MKIAWNFYYKFITEWNKVFINQSEFEKRIHIGKCFIIAFNNQSNWKSETKKILKEN